MSKQDNTLLYVAGAVGIWYFFLRPKPVPMIPVINPGLATQPVNYLPAPAQSPIAAALQQISPTLKSIFTPTPDTSAPSNQNSAFDSAISQQVFQTAPLTPVTSPGTVPIYAGDPASPMYTTPDFGFTPLEQEFQSGIFNTNKMAVMAGSQAARDEEDYLADIGEY